MMVLPVGYGDYPGNIRGYGKLIIGLCTGMQGGLTQRAHRTHFVGWCGAARLVGCVRKKGEDSTPEHFLYNEHYPRPPGG